MRTHALLAAAAAVLLLLLSLSSLAAHAEIAPGVNEVDVDSEEFQAHLSRFPPLRKLSDKTIKKWVQPLGPTDSAVLLLSADEELCGRLCPMREQMLMQLQVEGAHYRCASINVPKYNDTMAELAEASPFMAPIKFQRMIVPSIWVFREGIARPYAMDWDNPQKFVDYLMRYTETPAMKMSTEDDEITFNRAQSSARVVAHLDKNKPEQLAVFNRVANVLSQEMGFYYTFDNSLGSRLAPGKSPSLSFYPHLAKSGSQFSNAGAHWNFDELLRYVHKMYRRTLILMSPAWQSTFLVKDLKHTLVAFFDSGNARHRVNVEKMFNALVHARKISKHTDEFDSGAVDVQTYGQFAAQLGVDTEDLPKLVMINADLARLYYYDGQLGGVSISRWIDDFFDHKLKPNKRSAPLPEEQDDVIRILVNKNYQKVVMNNEKDVVVYLHHDRFPQCREHFPAYQQVAKKYEGDANMEFTRMDLTTNDPPEDLEIERMPAILMYPAYVEEDSDFEPIVFWSDTYAVEDISKFVERNRRTKFAPKPKDEL